MPVSEDLVIRKQAKLEQQVGGIARKQIQVEARKKSVEYTSKSELSVTVHNFFIYFLNLTTHLANKEMHALVNQSQERYLYSQPIEWNGQTCGKITTAWRIASFSRLQAQFYVFNFTLAMSLCSLKAAQANR